MSTAQVSARIPAADLLKGLAVVLMIQIHLFEVFATEAVADSLVGKLVFFLGGPPAAPVFMLCMGYFALGAKANPRAMALRGLKLFGGGLLLNIGLNANLLSRHFTETGSLLWTAVFSVDILLLAGMSLLVMAVLFKLFERRLAGWLGAVAAVLLATMLLAPLDFPVNGNRISILDFVLAFAGSSAKWSFFPLLPWLAYPLVGAAFRLIWSRESVQFFVRQWKLYLLAGTGILLLISLREAFAISVDLPRYYHHQPGMVVWCLAFVLLLMWAAGEVNRLAANAAPMRYLRWLGRNVTTAYVVQWLLIGNIGTALYQSQSLLMTYVWFVIVLGSTSMIMLARKR